LDYDKPVFGLQAGVKTADKYAGNDGCGNDQGKINLPLCCYIPFSFPTSI